MRTIKTLCFLAMTLLAFGCNSKGSHSVEGDWGSPAHQTEWGEMACSLSLRPDETCTLIMSPAEEPDAEPFVTEGTWKPNGKSNATIFWKNGNADVPISIVLVNATTITLCEGDDGITFTMKD
jgi:hypothetical protein